MELESWPGKSCPASSARRAPGRPRCSVRCSSPVRSAALQVSSSVRVWDLLLNSSAGQTYLKVHCPRRAPPGRVGDVEGAHAFPGFLGFKRDSDLATLVYLHTVGQGQCFLRRGQVKVIVPAELNLGDAKFGRTPVGERHIFFGASVPWLPAGESQAIGRQGRRHAHAFQAYLVRTIRRVGGDPERGFTQPSSAGCEDDADRAALARIDGLLGIGRLPPEVTLSFSTVWVWDDLNIANGERSIAVVL